MRSVPVLIIAFVTVLAGCGSVTFKRGAGPDSMAADERSCRAAGPDEAGFAACMRERGWFVAMTGEEAKTTGAADRWLEAQQGEPSAASTPAASAQPATETPSARPVAPATGTSVAPAHAAPIAPAAPMPRTEPAEPTFDPMTEVTVASWWKLGGSAAALDSAIAGCVASLGVAHRPDPGARRVTTGMRACLRADGWFAVGN